MANEITRLTVGGMTCAACSNRIERRLNKIDGVYAEVNRATESARIEHPASIAPAELVAPIRALGYTAGVELPRAAAPADRTESVFRRRLLVAAVLVAPPRVVRPVVPK